MSAVAGNHLSSMHMPVVMHGNSPFRSLAHKLVAHKHLLTMGKKVEKPHKWQHMLAAPRTTLEQPT